MIHPSERPPAYERALPLYHSLKKLILDQDDRDLVEHSDKPGGTVVSLRDGTYAIIFWIAGLFGRTISKEGYNHFYQRRGGAVIFENALPMIIIAAAIAVAAAFGAGEFSLESVKLAHIGMWAVFFPKHLIDWWVLQRRGSPKATQARRNLLPAFVIFAIGLPLSILAPSSAIGLILAVPLAFGAQLIVSRFWPRMGQEPPQVNYLTTSPTTVGHSGFNLAILP
jgi:hypothetical protein